MKQVRMRMHACMHALDPEVRTCVQEHVQAWNGENLDLNQRWIEKAIHGFDISSQAAGRLALLTALMPHQVNDTTVLAFRSHFPEDDKLLGALAWSSFTFARRIGTWLCVPST